MEVVVVVLLLLLLLLLLRRRLLLLESRMFSHASGESAKSGSASTRVDPELTSRSMIHNTSDLQGALDYCSVRCFFVVTV